MVNLNISHQGTPSGAPTLDPNGVLQHGWATYECGRSRNRHSCCAGLRVHIQNEAAIPNGDLTHAPENGKIDAAKALQAMKACAITTAETPQNILTEHLQGMTPDTSGHLPNLPDMRRNSVTLY